MKKNQMLAIKKMSIEMVSYISYQIEKSFRKTVEKV